MRPRNTLILTLLFILLGAYIYFYELNKKDGEKEKLLSFKNDEVEAVAFSRSGEEIRLEKDSSGEWKITEPLQTSADESTISDLLFTLSTTEVTRRLEDHPSREDLKIFGLDPPKIKVALTLGGDQSLPPILVGERTPVGSSAYVKREGEAAVLLSNASLLSSLDKKLFDFRDKTIIEFKKEAVNRFSVKGAQGEFVLAKKEEEWFIEQPESYRADQAEILGMLSTLQNMSARHFVEGSISDLGRYGLEQPRLRVAFSTGENEGPREIFFGDKREEKDEVYVTLDAKEKVYTVYESVFKELDKDLFSLRDKEVMRFSQDKVAKLQIHGPQESWSLVKGEEDEWRVEGPEKGKVRPGAVEDYIASLRALRAKGFAEDKPKERNEYGLEIPARKVSLQANNGEDLGTLLLGSKAGKEYYVKREDSATVYRIDEFSYRQIDKELNDFLEEKKQASPPAGESIGP